MMPYRQKMWGDILLALLDEAQTTSQIAYELQEKTCMLRPQIILMHHFGLIEPLGIREEDGQPKASGYYLDILWQTTHHTREHIDTQPNCHGCTVRERLLLTDVLYE